MKQLTTPTNEQHEIGKLRGYHVYMIIMETAVGKVCLTTERKAMSMMTSLSQRETTQPLLLSPF